MLQASLLFWKRLLAFLIDTHGFVRNEYVWCVVNKVIDGEQCTIVWYVDDMKVLHVNSDIVTQQLEVIQQEFGQLLELTTTWGKVHEYLVIRMDFSQPGRVQMTMPNYVKGLHNECLDDLMRGPFTSGATGHLLTVNPYAEKLDATTAELYHYLTAKLLYLSKRTQPDLQLPGSFLTTPVQAPKVDDWKSSVNACAFFATL
jgi:hypothetical protein